MNCLNVDGIHSSYYYAKNESDAYSHSLGGWCQPEQHGDLFPMRDWYEKLYDILDFESDDDDASWLTFVTSNYDRSLEHFLSWSIEYQCGSDVTERARTKLKSIRIIHAHGSLGPYPAVSYGIQGQPNPYLIAPNPNQPPAFSQAALQGVAKQIRLVADKLEDTEEFQSAQEAIAQAERVVFIGCGYDKRTAERLFPNGVPSDKEISGTIWPTGQTSKMASVKAIFDGKIVFTHGHIAGTYPNKGVDALLFTQPRSGLTINRTLSIRWSIDGLQGMTSLPNSSAPGCLHAKLFFSGLQRL